MPYWMIAAAALALNSAYLAATATASLFYYGNVVLHIVLGIALSLVVIRRLAARTIPLGPRVLAAAAPLAVAAASGLGLTVLGSTRPWYWLLTVHVVSSVAGAAVLAGWALRSATRQTSVRARFAMVCGVLVLALVGSIAATMSARRDDWRRAQYRISNPDVVPARMEEEGAGPQSPFFPSSSNTNVNGIIPANFFLTSASCGRCHKDIYDQWNSSTHHLSSFNNQWYRKSIEYMQDVVGTKPSKWCAGCHDHAVFFNGRFDKPIREQIDTPEAQAGLACTS